MSERIDLDALRNQLENSTEECSGSCVATFDVLALVEAVEAALPFARFGGNDLSAREFLEAATRLSAAVARFGAHT